MSHIWSGGDRLYLRVQNTDGTNTGPAEFRSYTTHVPSNVPADPVDDIFGVGFNVLADGSQLDPSKPASVMQFERIFAGEPDSAEGGFEWFLQMAYPETTFSGDPLRRPIGLFAEHGLDGTPPICHVGFETTSLLFSRYGDKALVAQWRLDEGFFNLKATRLLFDNNAVMVGAAKVGGSYADLLRFGTDECLQVLVPATVNAAARQNSVSGSTSLLTFQCTGGLNDGHAVIDVFGPEKSATYYMLHLRGRSTNGYVIGRISNNAGAAFFEVEGTTFAGQLFTGPGFAWVMQGVDAASNEYRVTAYNDLSHDVLFSIHRSTKRVSYKGPLSLDVASLTDAADDAAAASAGVPVGGVYRNGSALMVRVS